MSYIRNTKRIRKLQRRINGLRFDASAGLTTKRLAERRIASLKEQRRALQSHTPTPPPPPSLRWIWKEFVGCVAACYLLISLTPLGQWPDVFGIEPLPWGIAMVLLSALPGYVFAVIIACVVGKKGRTADPL